ncbi:MAG: DEAD/DEAH box helicase [Planctomycetota bacterium]
MARSSDPGWKIPEALERLRAAADPYIWDQGEELFRRGAVEDFEVLAGGALQVIVLDPRDARRFFVKVERDRDGLARARCECPYRLGGSCRHQVAALEYLRSVAEGGGEGGGEGEGTARAGETAEPPAPEGSILYDLVPKSIRVRTAPDGSLLRAVLRSLGSLRAPHRLGLQVYTGTGWTELRTPDVERWIDRGPAGPHPRDAALARLLAAEGSLRSDADSETLAAVLFAVAGTSALVDRTGEPLSVSLEPLRLASRLERAAGEGLAVRFFLRSPGGGEVPFEEVALVPSATPWVQLEGGTFRPLEAGAPGPALARLQEETWSEVSGDALDRLLAEGLQALEAICLGAVEEAPGLVEEVEGVSGARLRLEGTAERLEGSLEFAYGSDWVDASKATKPSSRIAGETVRRYPPAGQSLVRARRELEALGFRLDGERWRIEGTSVLSRILAPRPKAFVRIELPRSLEAANLVERAPALDVVVCAGPEGGAPAGEAPPTAWPRTGIAWLEVSPVLRDGERILPVDLGALRLAVERDPEGVLELEDGTALGLAHPAVRTLAELAKSGSPAGGPGREASGVPALRMDVPAIARFLGGLPGASVQFEGSARSLAEDLSGAASEEVDLDPAADAVLRPYQRDALRWFGALARWGLAGILADEMGLGKTLMTLAHLLGRRERRGAGTVLVVCPSSLVFNWLDEARRFFPALRAAGLHGEPPALRERLILEDLDLLVTSYALLRRDREALEAREFRAVVLDEAHHVKNPESQTAQAAFALRARERWALTGTPVENHLGELWSIFRFLLPGYLGDGAEFAKTCAEPIARGEEEALRALRSRIRPFLLRRTKAQVLGDLPPLIEQVERVPMTEAQSALYASYLERARRELEGADPAGARFQILAALTRLRQICCHPKLVLEREGPEVAAEDGEAFEGGKFALLRELLETAVEGGHRVLLYSQFTSLLDLAEGLLEDLGLSRCRLDGSTRDREGEVRRFVANPGIPVFLVSLKAGGLGLNLTQADTVILYDPWWNPAAEAQAAARAHRIGQTVPVHVHKLIAADSIEEKILALQASKRGLARSLVEGAEDPLSALTADELRALLWGA